MIYHSKQPILNCVVEVRRVNFLTSLYYRFKPEWKRYGIGKIYREIDNYFILKAVREGVRNNVIS